MFGTPKASVKITFNCPHASNFPEAEVLTDIFTRLLMDYLNEYAFYAQVAGLSYGISQTDSGFQVNVVGYDHKFWILLETVVEKIANFEVKADRFLVIKEMVIKEYENYKFQQPYQQAMYYCSLILQDHSWPWTEQLQVLPQLEVNDLVRFYRLMLSRASLECYVAGNIEPSEAESMIQHIEDVLFMGPNPISYPLFPSLHLTNRVVWLEKGMNFLYPVQCLNQSDDNSALVHYIQVHRDNFLLNVKLQLFALIAKQPAFHQLRSVEELGYITVLVQRNDSGVRGVQVIVQSAVKRNVNALIDMKLEKHKNLREESTFYWREISDGTLKFNRREMEVAALKKLTQQELIEFFDEYIKVGAPNKSALSVRVYRRLHSSEYTTDKSEATQANSV